MKKTDRKTENTLRVALTEACDLALEKHEGFVWLTHFVNYQNFPDSLSIVLVFETNEQLVKTNNEGLLKIIKDKLASIGIHIKDIRQHVSFDTEENCIKENNGKWQVRFEYSMLNRVR